MRKFLDLSSLTTWTVLLPWLVAGCAGAPPSELDESVERAELALSGNVLLVAASTTLNGADSAVRSRLQSLGFSVTTRAASSSTTADASGKALVVISSTVSPSSVGTKFRDVAVPVLTWESQLYDDLRLTAATSGNFGTRSSQRNLAISAPSHPMAAGLSGNVAVTTTATTYNWGRPLAGAVTIARLSTSPTEPAIFGYDAGAQLAGGQAAPARRVGLFFGDTTASALTANGWALFDEAVEWSVAATAPPRKVHIVYIVPSDRAVNSTYVANLGLAARHLRGFFHSKLGGRTYTLNDPIVTVLSSSRNSAWFTTGTFHNNILSEAHALTGVNTWLDPTDRWMLYIDVPAPCGNGNGASGSAATFPAQDLNGLSGLPVYDACSGQQDFWGRCRWVGGMGHELGHTLGLPHPWECEDGNDSTACPSDALMWVGYASYPNTYFTSSDLATLNTHPVLTPQTLSNVPSDCSQAAP